MPGQLENAKPGQLTPISKYRLFN